MLSPEPGGAVALSKRKGHAHPVQLRGEGQAPGRESPRYRARCRLLLPAGHPSSHRETSALPGGHGATESRTQGALPKERVGRNEPDFDSCSNKPSDSLTRPPFLHLLKCHFVPKPRESKIQAGAVWREDADLPVPSLCSGSHGGLCLPGAPAAPSTKQLTQLLLPSWGPAA